MKNNPQVAIMMPVYNGQQTLPLAISSLLYQTYPYWKCYIVNDGSTDGTKNYLNSLNDDRFVVIHFEKNRGRPYARQAALDAAEGKYLAFLDADDFYHPTKLQLQVNYLEINKNISLVGTGVGSYKNVYDGLLSVRATISKQNISHSIGDRFYVVHGSCFLILDLAKKIKYNTKLKHAQDTDFLTKYLKDRKYSNIDKVLYYYSEFQSVTLSKIIRTYYYDFLQKKTNLNKVTLSVKSIIIFAKVIYTLLIYLVFGMNTVLKRRGRAINEFELMEFKKCLHLLKKI